MATMTNLPNGEKGVLASPLHLLLLRAANNGGFVARGAGASDTQLLSAARAPRWYLKLQVEMDGRREVITGATLTPAGRRHLDALNAALAIKQHLDHIVTHGFGE